MHDELGLAESPDEINDEVVRLMLERYRTELPLLPGAVEAVQRLAARFPLAVASSSNRPPLGESGRDARTRVSEPALPAAGRRACARRRRRQLAGRADAGASRPDLTARSRCGLRAPWRWRARRRACR